MCVRDQGGISKVAFHLKKEVWASREQELHANFEQAGWVSARCSLSSLLTYGNFSTAIQDKGQDKGSGLSLGTFGVTLGDV